MEGLFLSGKEHRLSVAMCRKYKVCELVVASRTDVADSGSSFLFGVLGKVGNKINRQVVLEF